MTFANPARSAVERSFVDLRAFVVAANFPPAPDADRFFRARLYLDLPAGPVHVGAIALEGAGRVAGLPTDEFILVVQGELRIDDLVVAAGQSAVLPAGGSFAWRGTPGTRVVVMGCAGAPGASRPVPIDETAQLEPSGAPLAELLVGPTPSCRNHSDYRSANGEFVCGTWDSTPYHRRAMPYRHYELMHLLAGAVEFEDGAGRAATFEQGTFS